MHSILPPDQLCHDSWDGQLSVQSIQCLSSNTHPYVMADGDDKNIYYWCEKHAAKWTKFRRLTLEEVTILEVLET
jgi:tRNA G37 N-methylase TrmD